MHNTKELIMPKDKTKILLSLFAVFVDGCQWELQVTELRCQVIRVPDHDDKKGKSRVCLYNFINYILTCVDSEQ